MPKTRASSPAGGAQFTIGVYTGDGAATQAIVGVGFQPRFTHIWPELDVATNGGWKTDQDGLNAFIQAWGVASGYYEADHIISLDVDGFTVGDGTGSLAGNQMNVNLRVYSYICAR